MILLKCSVKFAKILCCKILTAMHRDEKIVMKHPTRKKLRKKLKIKKLMERNYFNDTHGNSMM